MPWYFYPIIYGLIIWVIFIIIMKYFPNLLNNDHDRKLVIGLTCIWPITLIIFTGILIGAGFYRLTKLIVKILPDKKPHTRKEHAF